MKTVFTKGDRVRVIGGNNKALIGQIGTVKCSGYPGNMAVDLDFEVNQRSSYGYFYFRENEIQLLTEEKTTLKEGKNMPKMENYTSVAVVSFLTGNNKNCEYEYACYDPGVQIGDVCVVMSAHHGLGLARVKALKASTDEELHREIVCVADFSAYSSRVEQRTKCETLKAQMQARAKKLQDLVLYETLAKADPEMQDLLSEYKTLQSV